MQVALNAAPGGNSFNSRLFPPSADMIAERTYFLGWFYRECNEQYDLCYIIHIQ